MYEIDPKFFNNDGSLDVEAACAAGRKAHSRTINEGVSHTLTIVAKAAATVFGPSTKSTLLTPSESTK